MTSPSSRARLSAARCPSSTTPAPVYELDITVAGTNVELVIPAADSSEWMWRHGVYDVELVDLIGHPTRLIQGSVTVSPEVTR